jgi:SAM-dependent methyltransferase
MSAKPRQYQSFPDAPGDSESLNKLKALRLPELLDKRFLDLGCNEGFFCAFASFAGAARVVGLDASADYIERARRRMPGLEFLHQSWDTLPDGPFDVVLLASALHYARDQAALIDSVMKVLSPTGTLVLELGVAPGNESAWVEVQRGSDKRLFATWPKLREVLAPYAWKLVSESTLQKGDPTPRYVLHINARKPVAYLLMEPGGFGKSTLCRELFMPAGVPVVSGDACMGDMAGGRLSADPALLAVVQANFSSATIDDTMRAVLAADLVPALAQVWLAQAKGQTFVLDASLAADRHAFVKNFFKSHGYMVVTLSWERPGTKVPRINVASELADSFFEKLLADPHGTQTFTLAPAMPFTGTLGAVTKLRVNPKQFEVSGWAVHENGRMPALIEVQLGDSRTEVTSFVREPRPQVQQRLNLPHAMYGFRILLPMPAGIQPAQVRDLVQVRGGKDAASLSPPFRTDPIKPKAGA